MRRLLPLGVWGSALCLLTLTTTAAAQTRLSEATNPAARSEACGPELRKLRLEMVEQGVEFQAWKIKQLERQLRRVEGEQQRLAEQERTLRQEIDGQVANSTPGEEGQHEEIELLRAALSEKQLKGLRATLQLVSEEEAEWAGQLQREQERLQELLKQVSKLKAELNR